MITFTTFLNHRMLKIQWISSHKQLPVKFILKSTNASCDLDPFPTRLLKQYVDDTIVPIIAIINLSMREGVVPPDFK